jgi:signal peptidase II
MRERGQRRACPGGVALTGEPQTGRVAGFRRVEIWAAFVLVVVDQITKVIVQRTIPLHDSVQVIPGLLNLTYVRNTGAAFGILNAVEFPYKTTVVSLLALTALIAIAAYALRVGSESWIGRAGLTAVLAGAVGNLIDRALRGYVVDFADFYWGNVHFWAFNVADAAITIGAVALILEVLGVRRSHVPQAV